MANHKRSGAIANRDFEHACDELFDELLGRWRGGLTAGAGSAAALDCGDRYEVRILARVDNPQALEVEVTGSALRVRTPQGELPAVEESVSFAHPVDRERTTARWALGVLTVTLPKQHVRRVKIE